MHLTKSGDWCLVVVVCWCDFYVFLVPCLYILDRWYLVVIVYTSHYGTMYKYARYG